MPATRRRPTTRSRPRPPRPRRGALSGLPKLLALSVLVFGLAVAAAVYTYQVSYDGRIYLGVSSMGLDLGGYTREEARSLLAAGFQRFARTPIVLRYQGREWRALPEELGVQIQMQDTVDAAYAVGREGNLLQRLATQLATFRSGRSVGRPTIAVDPARRSAYLASLAREVGQPPVDAQLFLRPGQQVVVLDARPGRRLNVERTSQLIDEAVRSWGLGGGTPALTPGPPPAPEERGAEGGLRATSPAAPGPQVDLAVDEIPPAVGEQDLAPAADLARKMMGAPLALRLGDKTWTLDQGQIQGMLSIRKESASGGQTRFDVVLDEAALRLVLEDVARQSEQRPRNARFDYSGGQLKAISPGAEGRRVDVAAALTAVKAALVGTTRVVDLPLAAVKPAIGPGDAAKLGIRELIEQASTNYDVGTAERRFNVELAASRLHGVVVPPGETFSFNDEVGEVSYRSGYKQGYGITQGSDGEVLTIPSEGGGICQVATTLFHGVFWAGYPIVERNWHLYWIPRYGLPPKGLKGLDATIDQVYDKQGKLLSAVDFRFRNNTESYVLIQARYDKKNLTFQLYGVKPRWQVKVDPPKIEKEVKADTTPVRQLDPTMAPGTEMMIEEARDGFQATITRTVTQDGKVLEQRSFVSTYRPSRNVYVYGPRPTPTATPSPPPAARVTTTPGPSPQATPAKPAGTPAPAATAKPSR